MPSNDEPSLSRVMALITTNHLGEAREMCTRYCENHRNDPQGWMYMAQLHYAFGDLPQIAHCCQNLTRLQPYNALAHYNSGVALMATGNIDGARNAFRKSIQLDPQYAPAHINLGNLYLREGKLHDGANSYREAVAIAPNMAEAHSSLGSALQQLDKYTEAEDCYRTAIAIDPRFTPAYINLASTLLLRERPDEALEYYRHVLSINPNHADAQYGIGVAQLQLADNSSAIAAFRQALALDARHSVSHSSLLFTLNYLADEDPTRVAADHFRWGALHELPVLGSDPRYRNNPDPNRRLTIGYVSPDFRNHSVAYFIAPVLAHHDPKVVETICYSNALHTDQTTTRLKALAGKWRDVYGMGDGALQQQIQDDGVDILVDLAGHSLENRLLLFARKPAPIQVSYLGYPNTTGLKAIDYRLSDHWADPPGLTDHLHSETIVRLAGGFLCYEPPADCKLSTALPADTAGHITFGSFNNLSKVNGALIKLWSRVLNAVPGSKLILKNKSFNAARLRDRFRELFANEGISTERLELVHWIASTSDHMALYSRIDIALDTYPYTGTTTTCEALWMGVPVVTLVGPVHASRVGNSILQQIGYPELVAQNTDTYVSIVRELSKDIFRLRKLRSHLRTAMSNSGLMAGPIFCAELESAYRAMWRTWCDKSRVTN